MVPNGKRLINSFLPQKEQSQRGILRSVSFWESNVNVPN